ncbi:hypothetical protein [Leucobacter sp. USHLN153]|uniref:hypothetical protein n=1 Tax=Leucobacter sp. USHLN153 TaxID=3081268 RepID=UPI00301A4DA1
MSESANTEWSAEQDKQEQGASHVEQSTANPQAADHRRTQTTAHPVGPARVEPPSNAPGPRRAWRSAALSSLAKRTQEQGIAAWVQTLNQIRLDRLTAALQQQDVNLRSAVESIDWAVLEIRKLITSNLGGSKGMHGFIAEIAETGVSNARSQILGGERITHWVNDNGPIDLLSKGVPIQQKFSAAGGKFSLGAVAQHLEKYPKFLEQGSKYQIPSDHYEVVRRLHAMTQEEASTLLTRVTDGPSYRDWKFVQAYFAEGSVPFESLEPSQLAYSEVQRGAFARTMRAQKQSLRETDGSQRAAAFRESLPSVREGARAASAAAAVEGGIAFVMEVARKRREGKPLKAFTTEDWAEIARGTGAGAATGAVRGLSIYALTNFAATSASAAAAIVTASVGVAEQAHRLRRGEISEAQFVEAAELVSLEAGVSAFSAVAGQALIPVPMLGALIGTSIGVVMYQAVAGSLSEREAQLLEQYLDEQRALDERLAAEYQDLLDRLGRSLSQYIGLLGNAFSPELGAALQGSASLALALGVAPDEVLDDDEAIAAYFLG